ncbi:dienelactone hydrolase family protein [Vitreimonas sp.]|uniref:dienelactone hydrolase family protein n=1 Tax=Vitreimonas sp. TaxID=3069702 RepID=UPI002ED8E54E
MGEWVQIAGPDGVFRAYMAKPAGAPKAAVVAIQEIFGVNAVMRGKADWLASQGFLAIAPDLFWRLEKDVDITDQSEAEWAKAMDLMKRFDLDTGIKDLQATIDHARGLVDGGKVGAVGYCLGGLLAYLTATRTDADASVGYYGVNIPNFLKEAENIRQPLMLHIAGKDGFVPPPAQKQMKDGLAGNSHVTLHDYPERDHAFTREGGKNYDAADAKAADDRTIAFFKANLV